jgi:tRNA nucleotidyltransferase/poly(A) polymerase
MTGNLCIKHFPEPVIYISEEPMCKKCIPEYLEKIKKEKGENEEESKVQDQTEMLVQMFGTPTMNMYTAEKRMINNCLIKIDDFRGDIRYINEEIDDRVKESKENLMNLPELMCQIFSKCEDVLAQQKNTFLSELDDIINKQQASFKRDNETKVPNFYERLSQKYNQLQQATSQCDNMADEQIIEILN